MASLFLLACLLIGCTADIPQDASGATCSEKDGQGCPGRASEYAEDDGAMSFLQTQMKVAPLEGLPQAVLVDQSQAVLVEGYSEEEELEQTEEDQLLPEDLALVEDMSADCAAKVARLDDLNGQALYQADGIDPQFPPLEISIAPIGTKCGDTAQGDPIYCSKYNTWKTFQAVAIQTKRPYSILGSTGIHFNDIDQGNLGNCYFLSALASVAYKNPKIIENMFVEKNLWQYGVFKTKWLVGGKESIIVVDSMIPAGDGDTYFTHASPTGAWWPVVLAKSWAKIFGSYNAIESGSSSTVVTAITQSPNKLYKPDKMTDDAIWDVLFKCTTKKYPMYATTTSRAQYGLAKGHAYVILEAYNHAVYGAVVKCYNPWGKDYNPKDYIGKIPNDETINGPQLGVFTIALDEFRGAFAQFSFNYVKAGYKATALSGLSPGKSAYDLSVSQPGKFWVSFVWPFQRMVKGCGTSYPTSRLTGALTTEPGTSLGKGLAFYGSSTGRKDYEFPGTTAGGGTYDLTAELKFEASFLKTYTISVYAPGDVKIVKNTKCRDNPQGLTMFSPPLLCSQATDASPLYWDVTCTGTKNSPLVQENCRNTCGLCPGGSPAGTTCADSTTYTDEKYHFVCSNWKGYTCTADTANNCPVSCGKC